MSLVSGQKKRPDIKTIATEKFENSISRFNYLNKIWIRYGHFISLSNQLWIKYR